MFIPFTISIGFVRIFSVLVMFLQLRFASLVIPVFIPLAILNLIKMLVYHALVLLPITQIMFLLPVRLLKSAFLRLFHVIRFSNSDLSLVNE